MSKKEQAELNRRVGVALGWAVVQNPNSLWGFVLKSPQGKKDFVRTKDTEEQAWAMIPLFDTDTAAADLVRQEIERRGWGWQVGEARPLTVGGVIDGTVYPGKPRKWRAAVTARSPLRSSPFLEDSVNSPYEALCLAFLAAVDAQEAKP